MNKTIMTTYINVLHNLNGSHTYILSRNIFMSRLYYPAIKINGINFFSAFNRHVLTSKRIFVISNGFYRCLITGCRSIHVHVAFR